ARRSYGYAARGLGEDAFALRQQLDAADNLGVGNVFRPSTALGDGLQRVRSIGRIADRQRARNRLRTLRFYLRAVLLDRGRNRRTARCLRAKELNRFRIDQPEEN